MKLVEGILFATSHQRVTKCLIENNISPESARTITATVVTWNENSIFIEIRLEFGKPGESPGDIRVRIHFDVQSGSFVFDEGALHR
jgi:hypothetical protein